MSTLPPSLLRALEQLPGFDASAFEAIHEEGKPITSVRINPLKDFDTSLSGWKADPVPWTQYGYYLEERPSFTFDPLFHAGCYYVQEASSMFLEQALRQGADLCRPLKVLDLSAAPGGKSTHIQSLLNPDSLLVSNEVIRARANTLRDNMIKWGCSNVVVTNNDPRDFAVLDNYFDIIVVDAPCSGSGLFRKDPAAINEWSENNVQLCSQRQQRILADIWPSLKPGGLLVYATCSFSPAEDEEIVKWMLSEFSTEQSGISYMPLLIDSDWGVTDTGFGYRFWPHLLKGEGFFMACIRKAGEGDHRPSRQTRFPERLTLKEQGLLKPWLETEQSYFIKHEQTVYAWPDTLEEDFGYLLNKLRVIYSGTIIGEMARNKIIPSHALALSALTHITVPRIALDYDQAIAYLQRKDLRLEAPTGWQLVTYEGFSLGWVNVLPNRINNYYPKELRILKDK